MSEIKLIFIKFPQNEESVLKVETLCVSTVIVVWAYGAPVSIGSRRQNGGHQFWRRGRIEKGKLGREADFGVD